LAVAIATLGLLVATEPSLSIVWDEGYTLGREERVRDWLRAVRDPQRFAATWQKPFFELVLEDQIPLAPPKSHDLDTRGKLFDLRVLEWFWPFSREEPHGHPPFYALVGLIGDAVVPWLEDLPRARFGPMLAFSLAAGALYAFMARRWGTWAGALAAGALVLQPNLFGHAHYAAYDALLTALWIGAILAFARAVEPRGPRRPRWGWVVLFGLLVGWAADTKLTGWFLPLPFLTWAALYRDRRAWLTLAVGGGIALVTIYAFNPPWWPAPIQGAVRFFVSNLTRGKTRPIPVLFLGQVYNTPNESLPWYNTLVWTLFVTPVGFLALGVWGMVRALARVRSEPFGLLALGNWAFLLLLRALPHTPGHDGVRQFLAAFGCLAVLAGLGAASAVERLGKAGKALIVAAIAEGAISVAVMMPVPLSYFSPLVGGLPGTTALGMEPTYYWDALSPEALDWLNRHTAPGEKVKFATEPTSWLYLQRSGRLKMKIFHFESGVYVWYVLQNRPGAMEPYDRDLVRSAKPAFVVHKLGVPLVWVFPFEEVRARSRAAKGLGTRPPQPPLLKGGLGRGRPISSARGGTA
jgi:hypothetical protein